MKGIITGTLDWIMHPAYSDPSPKDWLAGLALILIAAYLWHTVLRLVAE